MLKKSKWQKMLLVSVFLCLLFPRESYAYLDPGSGSFFIQMLLAGLFAASIALKSFWRRIASFFTGLFKKKHDKNSDQR